MIYLDTSVALAQLLAEDRQPPAELWRGPLVSSRLLQYELWVRLNARGLAASHSVAAGELIGRIDLLELVAPVLDRALEPFPIQVRTLDALHLASMAFLSGQRQSVTLASYDERLLAGARAMGFAIAAL